MELELLRRLSRVTNVVPVLGKSDLQETKQTETARDHLAQQLLSENIRTFNINSIHQEASRESSARNLSQPLAVSSALSSSDDDMDASLLMSPEYTQPFVQSDLQRLVSTIFDPSTVCYLRHSAARKFIQWRRSTIDHPPSMSLNTIRPSSLPSTTPAQRTTRFYHQTTGTSIALSPPNNQSSLLTDILPSSAATTTTTTANTLTTHPLHTIPLAACLADHTDRETRLAQVHLARWSADLQRALRNERRRFAALQQAERTAWLHDRLAECVEAEVVGEGGGRGGGGAIVPSQEKEGRAIGPARLDPRDPLGLLDWRERMLERGFVVVKMLGGVGMVGAVVVWCVRVFGEHGWSLNWHWGPWGWGGAGERSGLFWLGGCP